MRETKLLGYTRKQIKSVMVNFMLGVCPSCKNQFTEDWCMACERRWGITKFQMWNLKKQ